MLKKELQMRKMRLEKLRIEAERDLKDSPQGNLRIVHRPTGVQYYHVTEKGDTLGHYIRKAEKTKAIALAQKNYSLELLAEIDRELQAINNILEFECKDAELAKVYDDMNVYRKELVVPRVLSDEEYIKQWESEPYVGKGFAEGAPEHYTDKGERVRSKSEVDIANAFLELGIPYKYECPVLIDGRTWVYPDFKFLIVPERRESYFEHFGMMDDPQYLKEEFFFKLKGYQRNGIIPGVNLFMTFESKANPLDKRDVRKYLAAICGK